MTDEKRSDVVPWLPPPTAAPKAKPREHVWTLTASPREGAYRIDCELMGHSEYGWECVLSKDGEWLYGRRFDKTRGEAMIEADEHKARYLGEGGTVLK